MRYFNPFFYFYSLVVKHLSRVYIPKSIRRGLLHFTGRALFKMNREDFDITTGGLESFNNINEFFTREIDLTKRPLSKDEIVSPCEGTLIEYGNVTSSGILAQVKGIDYSLDKLTADPTISRSFYNGSFFNIYLSPRNYHRFHSPIAGTIEYIKHIPGLCLPVNKWGQKQPGIYTLNERYIVCIKNEGVRICMAIVGAAAVRGIKILKQKNSVVEKGELLGMFELGSSIVLIYNKKISERKVRNNIELKVRGPVLSY